MDLIEPDEGKIHLFDKRMDRHAVEIKNKIGFIYSELYLNDKWNVKKIESYIAPFYSEWDYERFDFFLKNLIYL